MSFCTSVKPLPSLTHCLLLCSLAILSGAQPSRSQEKRTTGKVEKKTYEFKEAKKEMEYTLFVPSTYDKAKKTPLVVALHGLGGNPQQMIRSRGLTEQAEKHGYIVVAPMGYNSSGWYGAQGPGRGMSRPGSGVSTPPGSILPPRLREGLNLTDEQKKKLEELQKEVDASLQKVLTEAQQKKLKESPGRGFGGGQDAPENLGELSEKDVMNVLALVRKELNVDEKRIYLIGHSMGGAGTYHLGTKYPEIWTGLGPIAAAGAPRNTEKLKNIPVFVVHGDKDTVVQVAGARRAVERLKEQNVVHEYLEIAGAGHGDVIGKGMPKIFEFFEKQYKERTK